MENKKINNILANIKLKNKKTVKKKKRKKKLLKKQIIQRKNRQIIAEYLVLIMIIVIRLILPDHSNKEIKITNEKNKSEIIFSDIKNRYNTYVRTIRQAKLYTLENNEYKDEDLVFNEKEINNYKSIYFAIEDNKYKEIGSVSEGTELVLSGKRIENDKDIYFKLNNLDYYIKYMDVEKINTMTNKYATYNNYLPFNINVISKFPAILHSDDGYTYIINEEINKPVIIKDVDKYYIEYDKKLLYIKNTDVKEIINTNNYVGEEANEIAVILYHYVYNDENKKGCTNTVICHSIPQVRSHFDYLKTNNYYTTTLEDIDLWLDGKIRLPRNSVTITIDDGWYLDEMKILLHEYKFHGNVFLITSLVPASAYASEYMRLYSHTDNMHYGGKCPGDQGSPIKCLDRDSILADLKLSREKLNNTTYFSWPFYEYNDYSIGLLKEAGFTMAFKGGMYKATRGVDKFLVPRITIHNTTDVNQFANYIR